MPDNGKESEHRRWSSGSPRRLQSFCPLQLVLPQLAVVPVQSIPSFRSLSPPQSYDPASNPGFQRGGRLPIVQVAVTDLQVPVLLLIDNVYDFPPLMSLDLLMFSSQGKERALGEFEALLTAVGLKVTRVVKTRNMSSVIEVELA